MNTKNLRPANVVSVDEMLVDRITGWVKVRKLGIADYYEMDKHGKLVKRCTIPFNPKLRTLWGKYLILKEKNQKMI
jgi:hypothetical protein